LHSPLPSRTDVILRAPRLCDAKVAISFGKLSFVPDGPDKDIYDFSTAPFALQPQRKLDNFGFFKEPMLSEEQPRFFFCALTADVLGLEISCTVKKANIFRSPPSCPPSSLTYLSPPSTTSLTPRRWSQNSSPVRGCKSFRCTTTPSFRSTLSTSAA
jgi:hypothetical protein